MANERAQEVRDAIQEVIFFTKRRPQSLDEEAKLSAGVHLIRGLRSSEFDIPGTDTATWLHTLKTTASSILDTPIGEAWYSLANRLRAAERDLWAVSPPAPPGSPSSSDLLPLTADLFAELAEIVESAAWLAAAPIGTTHGIRVISTGEWSAELPLFNYSWEITRSIARAQLRLPHYQEGAGLLSMVGRIETRTNELRDPNLTTDRHAHLCSEIEELARELDSDLTKFREKLLPNPSDAPQAVVTPSEAADGKKRPGRPKASYEEVEADKALLADWEKAKDTVDLKTFARDQGISLAVLKKRLNTAQRRRRRSRSDK